MKPEDAVRTFKTLRLEVHEDEQTNDPSKKRHGEGSGGTASKRQKKELKAWQEAEEQMKADIEVIRLSTNELSLFLSCFLVCPFSNPFFVSE